MLHEVKVTNDLDDARNHDVTQSLTGLLQQGPKRATALKAHEKREPLKCRKRRQIGINDVDGCSAQGEGFRFFSRDHTEQLASSLYLDNGMYGLLQKR